MKKTLLTLALAATTVSSVFAQGYVLFNNSGSTKISTNNVTVGVTSATPGSFYYALFYSSTATTVNGSAAAISGAGKYVWTDSAWTFSGAYGTNAAAGRFGSVSADANNSGGTAITGITGGASEQFVVIGWSADIGSTLAALEAWYANPTGDLSGLIGESMVSGTQATVPAGGGLGTPPALFGTGAGLINGFEVSPVPEPTTIALIGLGGLGLAMIRRRK